MHWSVFLAPLLMAAAPVEVLTIGGERFPQAEILDARAVGDGTGPAVFITFDARATARLARVSKALIGKVMPLAIGGTVITNPVVQEPIESGNVQISGGFASFAEAEALALRISGKPPLPETTDD